MNAAKRAYREYLKSEHWAALRASVIQRDGCRCVRCGNTQRLQAHHLFYRDRWEDSVIDDLITLCRPCHKREHGIVSAWKRKENGRSGKQKQPPLSQREVKDRKKYAPLMFKSGRSFY